MVQEGKISITVDKETTWKQLSHLRVDLGLESLDDVIQELLKIKKRNKL